MKHKLGQLGIPSLAELLRDLLLGKLSLDHV